MTAASKAQAVTRWGAVTLMATAVLTATGGGFAQSYAGLYQWALEHGLNGWKAQSFPLLVDLFIIVGELGLFLLAIDAFVLKRKHLLSWVDFMLPLFIAMAGWTASLIFNVGHVVQREFSYQATAAVPPIVSMLGLFVLLRTLHRYVSSDDSELVAAERKAEEPRALAAPITLQNITVVPLRITAPSSPAELTAARSRVTGEFPAVMSVPGSRPAMESASVLADADAGRPRSRSAARRRTVEPAVLEADEVDEVDEDDEIDEAASHPVAAAPRRRHAARTTGESAARRAESAESRDEDVELTVAAGAAARNGHAVTAEPAAVWSSAPSQPDPETLRAVVIEVLGRHHGDIAATCSELTAEGYVVETADVRKTRENHWFPYAVYRLLARHLGDGDAVKKDLREQGIDYDPESLDALVRSWRG